MSKSNLNYHLSLLIGDQTPGINDQWMALMTSENREWNRIYEDFKPQLEIYIEKVLFSSISDNEAAIELEELKNVFSWDEEFVADWSVQVYTSSIPVEYSSLEELHQAVHDRKIPFLDAHDAWNESGLDLAFQWDSVMETSIRIDRLRLI